MSTTTASSSPDAFTNLLILLPTGTFVSFTILAPIITNNGDCHTSEKIATGVILGVFAFCCAFSSFTDSFVTSKGSIWYGIVTPKGLWSLFYPKDIPGIEGNFYVGAGDQDKYKLHLADFFIAILSVISFATLSLLCTPFTDCFFPDIPSNILKSIPIPVNSVIGLLFSFAPPARNGIGNGVRVTTTTTKDLPIENPPSSSDKSSLEPILPASEDSLQSTDTSQKQETVQERRPQEGESIV
ncbi:hypothetical protein MPTK1_4g17620 [Marchantia polymorpha subsp. ruderalis]|uniref:Uncharacterized protein n=2 Tax=Marchantia polymorpha TaxID=3197 RepID=A0AAF6BAX0_MARPO|nr:hypothetical protein MARPO_0041s0044 [Marchantia polymorpha]BBN09154.1 hypothetical protein Mp_4g17620 [Marchantia polymorpha subsp. ruderalis]|eukprot:PTQ40142.1 hypothetical protein MARPO_0041s0044 [Marchantia polymorpha]